MKKAIKELDSLISELNKKYHFDEDDLLRIGFTIMRIAMLSSQGTFEGESRK